MHITFYGGVREVTGSMHLLWVNQDAILMDCGMFQGRRKESDQKNRILPFDPGIITNVILSHAHIDHSGRLPLITKNKSFNGNIICTKATEQACGYLLLDSAHIQQSDSHYINYKTVRSFLYQSNADLKNKKDIEELLKQDNHQLNIDVINNLAKKHRLEIVEPLYSVEDAKKASKFFVSVPYDYPVEVGYNATCRFYDAGHILGSAISIIRVYENGKKYVLAYTGDIGRFNKNILKNPNLNFDEQDIDLMIMESTYGDRKHESVIDLKPQLEKVIIDTFNRGGSVIIPSFAYGRTQEVIYVLHELYNEGRVPKMPVYVDSPLSVSLTKVFGEHPELYDGKAHKTFLEHGENPFSFNQITYISSVADSMELMKNEKPHITIASSGMCEAGRILHHLRYKIHQSKNTILIVGFMAKNTLGSRIQELSVEYEKTDKKEEAPIVKILNKTYPLKAQVITIGGFSAHADKDELLYFLKNSNLKIKKIAIVHGEEEQSLAFAKHLDNEGFSVMLPCVGESVTL